jgi:signal peptidase I
MDAPPTVNPYAPPPESSAVVPERRAPRWLAFLLSLVAFPLAAGGLFVLRRSRRNWLWVGAGLLVQALYVLALASAPRLALAVWALHLACFAAGIVVTGTARAEAFRGWNRTLLIAGAVLVVGLGLRFTVRAAGAESFKISNDSMMPTLLIGDHIMVSKARGNPARGDVVVFKYPLAPDTVDYVKRVIGLPGDTVVVAHNQVLVNGGPLPRRMLEDVCPSRGKPCHLWEEKAGDHVYRVAHVDGRPASDFGPQLVPAGHYFVMGDSRDNSADSRTWGTVAAHLVKGRVMVVAVSSTPGRLGHPVE